MKRIHFGSNLYNKIALEEFSKKISLSRSIRHGASLVLHIIFSMLNVDCPTAALLLRVNEEIIRRHERWKISDRKPMGPLKIITCKGNHQSSCRNRPHIYIPHRPGPELRTISREFSTQFCLSDVLTSFSSVRGA